MKYLYLSSLLTVVACSPLSANSEKSEEAHSEHTPYKQDYPDAIAFMDAFLNPNEKPGVPLKYWVTQMFFLFNHDPKLKPFIQDIAKTVRYRDANRILSLFLTYQGLFPANLRQFIIKRGLGNVKESLTRRVALAPATAAPAA